MHKVGYKIDAILSLSVLFKQAKYCKRFIYTFSFKQHACLKKQIPAKTRQFGRTFLHA